MKLVDEMRALAENYEDHKREAQRKLAAEAQQQAERWELETTREIKEKVFSEVLVGVRESAGSGLRQYNHHLPATVGDGDRYTKLAVPLLRRLLEEEGFTVAHVSGPAQRSSGVMSLPSVSLTDQKIRVSW